MNWTPKPNAKAEKIYHALRTLARTSGRDPQVTRRAYWRNLVVAFYPRSNTYNWWGEDGKKGPISKRQVISLINIELGEV